MSIAEQLTTIAENVPKVYEAGYEKGKAEGGGDDYYDTFWDKFQEYGNKKDYRYAFAHDVWTDETYHPKYPIKQNGYAYTLSMFYANTKITDTKVDIELLNTSNSNSGVFGGTTNLVTIRKLTLGGNVSFNGWFTNAHALTNITIGGSIDVTISFSFSPLSKQSIESVINALNEETIGQTVTFKKTAVDRAFETSVGAADGAASAEWTNLVAAHSNWTISLV